MYLSTFEKIYFQTFFTEFLLFAGNPVSTWSEPVSCLISRNEGERTGAGNMFPPVGAAGRLYESPRDEAKHMAIQQLVVYSYINTYRL